MNNNPPSITLSIFFGFLYLIQLVRFGQLVVKRNVIAQRAMNIWSIVSFIPIVIITLEPSALPNLASLILWTRESIIFLLSGAIILIEGVEDPEILYKAAHQLELHKKYTEAIGIQKQIIDRNPEFYKAYINLAALVGMQGHFHEAETLCRKAIVIKPNYGNAHYYLGLALKEQGNLEAIEELKTAVQLGLPEPLLTNARRFIEVLGNRKRET
jgi:tetratricopeptide (TPR) repeat protein